MSALFDLFALSDVKSPLDSTLCLCGMKRCLDAPLHKTVRLAGNPPCQPYGEAVIDTHKAVLAWADNRATDEELGNILNAIEQHGRGRMGFSMLFPSGLDRLHFTRTGTLRVQVDRASFAHFVLPHKPLGFLPWTEEHHEANATSEAITCSCGLAFTPDQFAIHQNGVDRAEPIPRPRIDYLSREQRDPNRFL